MAVPRWLLTILFACATANAAMAQAAPLQLQPKKPPAASPAKPPSVAKVPALDQAGVIAKANEYLNATRMMTADFVQIGGDGRRTEGKLYVLKPGQLRFAYNSPATMEIVADGTTVVVKDKKHGTQDPYFIGQTPLKFLLKDQIDISRDTKIIDITSDASSTSVLVEDQIKVSGTFRIKFTFDSTSFALKQWKVTDPQGYDTLVSLFNVDTSRKPDSGLFKIDMENFKSINNNK